MRTDPDPNDAAGLEMSDCSIVVADANRHQILTPFEAPIP
jgi:hypothetical protein